MPFTKLLGSFMEDPNQDSPVDFYVIRDYALLKKLADAFPEPEEFVETVFSLVRDSDIELALVPVRVRCRQGVPSRFARLYSLPSTDGPMEEPPHHVPVAEREVLMSHLTGSEEYISSENFYSIIGFLVSGDRNYTEKCATGLGYVSLSGLVETMQTVSEPRIAFRNQHCFNYEIVQMSIIH